MHPSQVPTDFWKVVLSYMKKDDAAALALTDPCLTSICTDHLFHTVVFVGWDEDWVVSRLRALSR